MAKQDFAVGLLKGLYEGGLGNPEVAAKNRELSINEAYKNAEIAKTMGEAGMVPDVHPADHPVRQKIGNFITSMFGGAPASSLATAYKKDPNAPSFGLNPDTYGVEVGTKTNPLSPTAIPMSRKEGLPYAIATGKKAKGQDVMLVYDSKKGPRVERSDYVPQPGEFTEKSNLADSLGKIAAFQSNESRSGFYGARESQIGLSAVTDIKQQLDPSNLSRSVPIGAAASGVKRAINGLSLLNQGTVTKTALEATMGDLDSILTQAGATVEGRKMLNTPNFLQNVTNFRSFVSASPDQVNVPPGMVKIYKNILNELGPISQKNVADYVNRTAKLIKPKALSFMTPEQFDSYKQEVIDSYDIKKQLTTPSSSTGGNDLSGMSDDELRKIAGQ